MKKVSRNDLCPCGSGKKYKQCCQPHEEAQAKAPPVDSSIPKAIQTALEHHQAGRLSQAEAIYRQILQVAPNHPDALHFLGAIAYHQGKNESAVELISKAIRINPSRSMYYNLGNALQAQGKPDEAVESYRKALLLKPDYTEAHINLGNVLQAQGKLDEAVEHYHKALSLRPGLTEAHYNLGNALQAQGKLNEAIACFYRALLLKPDYAEAHNSMGMTLYELGRLNEAEDSYRRTLELKPDFAEANCNLGNTLMKLDRLSEAEACYRRALELKPEYVEAHSNLSDIFYKQDRLFEAEASLRQVLAIKPDYAGAHNNLGTILNALKRFPEAEASFLRALELKPDFPFAFGMYLHNKMHCCDWEKFEENFQGLLCGIDAGKPVSNPFCVLAIPSTLAQQKRCAEIWVQEKCPEVPSSSNVNARYSHDKIRIAYFSADFYNHPGSYLMAGMFEEHDKSRFELIAFSFGPDKNDEMRNRVAAAFDDFIDVRNQSDKEIAMLARSLEIDIAIDRKGFTAGSRTGIFALRPAPIQVSYLAYPGTMGAPYIDYLIADPTLIPVVHQQHYSEKIVYLPDSYQANDSRRRISERQFTRSEAGLPDEGFVFCCFNNNYKITPTIFNIWMQFLKQVEGSVLWLFEDNAYAGPNLQNEAMKRGIAPDRIIFAKRMDLPDHLARHRLADLFLDTLFYNAHTTASDALWAGLPVLTYLGDTFAGRVAASLLNAVGLPELITHSHEEYKSLALELATNPEKLASIKQQLARNRITHPLFNTVQFTRHIEDAYIQMWQRHQGSLSPDHIYVRANK